LIPSHLKLLDDIDDSNDKEEEEEEEVDDLSPVPVESEETDYTC
jgi:hypothetical protein